MTDSFILLSDFHSCAYSLSECIIYNMLDETGVGRTLFSDAPECRRTWTQTGARNIVHEHLKLIIFCVVIIFKKKSSPAPMSLCVKLLYNSFHNLIFIIYYIWHTNWYWSYKAHIINMLSFLNYKTNKAKENLKKKVSNSLKLTFKNIPEMYLWHNILFVIFWTLGKINMN